MEEQLKKDIAAMVADIFSQKEETEVRKQTEEALQASAQTIEDLTQTLEAKNSEITDLQTKVSSLEEAQVDFDSKLEAATEEKTSVETKLEEAETKLANIEKDALTATRMEELTTAGVVRKDAESQTAKVREMSDEEFASYKEELEAVKASIMDTIKAADEAKEEAKEEPVEEVKEESKEDAEESEEASEEDSEEKEEASDDEEEGTPPANVNPAHAAQAAMNFEVMPSDDLMAKYADLGKAMAGLEDK